jgi:sensor domain CHASE-containing protein
MRHPRPSAGCGRRRLRRLTQVVAYALQKQTEELAHDQESVAIWDDAVNKVAKSFDRKWWT